MENQGRKAYVEQAPIKFETLSEGRKDVMRYLLQSMGEQTAIIGAASQKHVALCNMGGIAALLAFAGTKGLDTAGMMVSAFYAFAVGLVLVSVSMGCSYHATAKVFELLLDDLMAPVGASAAGTGKEKKKSTILAWCRQLRGRLLDISPVAATLLAWAALGAFVVGMVYGGLALDHLPPAKA